MRQYLLAMAVRTACFPLAVWAFATERYVVATVAALGAAIIPSFAVMLANATDRRNLPSEDVVASPVQGLGPGRTAAPRPAPEGPHDGGHAAAGGPVGDDTPIQGTVLSSRDTAYPAADPAADPTSDPGSEPVPDPGPAGADERRDP